MRMCVRASVVLNVLTMDNDCEHRNDQYIRHTAAV